MLGGGSFTGQNQALPGAYINFVSAATASAALSERGIAAVPLTLSWGPEKQVFEVTAGEFQKDCFKIFGYPYDAPEMLFLRELYLNITKGVFYRLNTGVKAANDYAAARHGGKRGNDIKIVIAADVDQEDRFVVKTLVGTREMDSQKVTGAAGLQDNTFVEFKKDATLALTAGAPLTGGTDGEAVVGSDHSDFLAAVEPYSFHALCCPVMDAGTKALYVAYTKRLRDECGVKFQTIVYQKNDADYEGVISVENKAAEQEQGLVYWVTGASAACSVSKSNENRIYKGELTVDANQTQTQLSDGVRAGKFLFHKVGSDIRVLQDINTLVTLSDDKGEDFRSNQTVRVLDQIGNDIASVFNTQYLGTVPNDAAGRTGLWNSIVSYCKKLAQLRAIEEVKSEDITVAAGESKRSVVISCPVTPINCMSQLYMTVIVE